MSPAESPSAAEGRPSLAPGELVELDYELWSTTPTGEAELIDTTREAVATKAGLSLPEGRKFGPRAHEIGESYFPEGIEKAIAGAKIGEEFTREFPPAEAFGERDPRLIELFSMHEISRLPEMRREDAELNLGTVLTIRGRRGRVTSMTAARVRVDFNPPYSGRTVRGTFKLLQALHEPAEIVRGLLAVHYGHAEGFHVEVKGKTVTIRLPDRSKFDFAWMAAKPRLIEGIRRRLKPHAIHLVEEYLTPTEKKPAAEGTSEAAGGGPSPPTPAPESG